MRPTQARIHRDSLYHNLNRIRELVGPSTALCAAVKANAYGHGVSVVVPWMEDAGVEAFGVATVGEAAELRSLGVRKPIFLLGTLQSDEWGEALDADVDFFVWSSDAIATLARCASRKKARVHLKVDTGMGRVGCRPEEADGLVRQILHSVSLEWVGLCTHFASSDGEGPVTVDAQMKAFRNVLDSLNAHGWTPPWVHTANSGAIVAWPQTFFNMVRPGIALYGYPHVRKEEFRPVMELVSKVGYVKTVPAGTALSYGSRYVTTETTDVVTIPIGYADGYRRTWSNRAEVWVGDRRYRVSGTVCMDQFMVDVGPNSGIRLGDPVVLFGAPKPERPYPTAEDLAALDETISYEILCGISARVPRVPV